MRFSIAVFGLICESVSGPAIAPTFQRELDPDFREIVEQSAMREVSKLPVLVPREGAKYLVDDFSKILGYYGLNEGFCVIRRYLAYMPVCVRENYIGDPEPGGKYGIRIRKWKNNSCVEIVAKLLDKPEEEEGVPRKAFYIQVEMFQPAVVALGWLKPNKCKHEEGTVYETIEDPLWTTSMADTILTLKTQEERLDAWIRFMASLSLGQSRDRYLQASALQFIRAFQLSMIAVTVFDISLTC